MYKNTKLIVKNTRYLVIDLINKASLFFTRESSPSRKDAITVPACELVNKYQLVNKPIDCVLTTPSLFLRIATKDHVRKVTYC